MGKEVLILGNGASRKHHMDFVKNWEGPIWACNWAYQELITGEILHIERLLGDKRALIQALPAKHKYKLQFEPICKGHAKDELHECTPAYILGVERKKIFDSGSTLVHIALLEGYDKIYLVGFDLGGKDMYVENHHIRNKSSWIRKWRMLRDEFGLDRIEFIGKDHKPFIESNLPIDYYAQLYTMGVNHLSYAPKQAKKYHDDVIILENGMSRLRYSKELQNWEKELWVCDNAFVDHNKFNQIYRVGSIQNSTVKEAVIFGKNKKLDYIIFTRDFVYGIENDLYIFKERRGWLTGPLMVAQALYEGYNRIYLMGFDIGEKDLYGKNVLKSSQYVNQLLTLKKETKDFNKRVQLMQNEKLTKVLKE